MTDIAPAPAPAGASGGWTMELGVGSAVSLKEVPFAHIGTVIGKANGFWEVRLAVDRDGATKKYRRSQLHACRQEQQIAVPNRDAPQHMDAQASAERQDPEMPAPPREPRSHRVRKQTEFLVHEPVQYRL